MHGDGVKGILFAALYTDPSCVSITVMDMIEKGRHIISTSAVVLSCCVCSWNTGIQACMQDTCVLMCPSTPSLLTSLSLFPYCQAQNKEKL